MKYPTSDVWGKPIDPSKYPDDAANAPFPGANPPSPPRISFFCYHVNYSDDGPITCARERADGCIFDGCPHKDGSGNVIGRWPTEP